MIAKAKNRKIASPIHKNDGELNNEILLSIKKKYGDLIPALRF